MHSVLLIAYKIYFPTSVEILFSNIQLISYFQINLNVGDIDSTADEILTAEVNKFGEYIRANMVYIQSYIYIFFILTFLKYGIVSFLN